LRDDYNNIGCTVPLFRAGAPIYYIVTAMPVFSGHQLVLSAAQGLELATLNKDVLSVNPSGTHFVSAGNGQGRIAQVTLWPKKGFRLRVIPPVVTFSILTF
jgi:hypothetical protein